MNTTTFTIRDAEAQDRPAIRELTLSAYGQYADSMVPSAWEALRNALIGAIEATGPVERIVAVKDGAVIGSVMLFPASGEGTKSAGGRMIWPELRLLAVAAEQRCHGVGEALIDACIARARAAGVPALGLYSSKSMQAAIRLYGRKGFQRVPEYDFRPPGAELVMAFCLPFER
jgi:predicted N-acetyltransferase YhbS